MWEEPPISGDKGSGTIFFSGCNMRCVYCQNHAISQTLCGKPAAADTLAEHMLCLMRQGAHNINLVTPTPHVPAVIEAVNCARAQGLNIPIVYNTGGYDSPETIEKLKGTADIYLPDFKYATPEAAQRYGAPDNYPQAAAQAIKAMYRQAGGLRLRNGLAVKGLLIRHMVLPCGIGESKAVLRRISELVPPETHLSILRQHTPLHRAAEFKEINRTVTAREYEAVVEYAQLLGFYNIYVQKAQSADKKYVPDWNMI